MVFTFEIIRQTTSASFGGYNNYKVYHAYGPYQLYMPKRLEYYLVTHEDMKAGQKVDIDWDAELSDPNNRETSAHGTRAFVYRPVTRISPAFTIVSRLNPEKPVEEFGNKTLQMQDYWIFKAHRKAQAGYKDEDARIITKIDYWKGQDIPFNELSRLRGSGPLGNDPVTYLHDETKYYARAARNFGLKSTRS